MRFPDLQEQSRFSFIYSHISSASVVPNCIVSPPQLHKSKLHELCVVMLAALMFTLRIARQHSTCRYI